MSDCVIEVGPATVRGRREAPEELVSAAVECIDDDLGLLDERVVSVQHLWADVIRAVVNREDEAVVLVCPTWWSTFRIDRVREAAQRVTCDVTVVLRGPALARDGTVVVEIAAELIAVTGCERATVFLPILRDARELAAAVHAAVERPVAVVIDAPTGVDGAEALGGAIAERLRGNQIPVAWADADAVRRAATTSDPRDLPAKERRPLSARLRKTSALAGLMAAATVLGGFALRGGEQRDATRLLVEGRIAVTVPAAWPVRRVTSGPGSARLQLVSPSDDAVGLHLTQSVGGPLADLMTTAESLRAALATEPQGVFVDFDASDVRVGRPAVTYREVRGGRTVTWTVLVDRNVRIAIGCQSPAGHEVLIRDVCDQAVGSAHALP